MSDVQPSGDWETGPLLQHIFQTMTMWGVIAAAVVAWGAVIASATQLWPWIGLDMRFGSDTVFDAGPYVQTGLAILLTALCTYLPSVGRMLSLERSHRRFSVTMDDVVRAYQISHRSDRGRAFALSSEFDSVRERLLHMRDHPDLSRLEPEVLELAAQMSHTTRDFADLYSDERLERARAFLKERQHELNAFQEKLTMALSVTQELRRWQDDVEASEREANRQMDVLEKDLREILPSLGYELDDPATLTDDDHKVVPLQGATSTSKER
ncbi:DNA repair protein [Celeribacter marinus]|uniref:DNA repair protein n=1 Tax=Celeribacter marinus TaxID=1397108 RepID=UPI003F6B3BA9